MGTSSDREAGCSRPRDGAFVIRAFVRTSQGKDSAGLLDPGGRELSDLSGHVKASRASRT